MEIPYGYFGDIRSRSSAFRDGLQVSGVIDSNYRGEVMVMVYNTKHFDKVVHKGDRISQMIILPVIATRWTETAELTPSARGTDGFGSTGK